MNRLRRYCFAGTVGIIFYTVLLNFFYTDVFVVKNFTITYDSFFSDAFQKEINTYLHTAYPCTFSPKFLKTMAQQYVCIKHIYCVHKKHNNAHISIEAYRPWYTINNQEVLLEHGALCDKSYYIRESLQNLYSFCMSSSVDASNLALCCYWLKNSTDDLFKHFFITWVNAQEIQLVDKNKADFKVICHHKIVLDNAMIERFFCLRNDQFGVVASKKMQRNVLIADARFNNQIVLYRKRGNDEGKNIF